jgi:hypothetical protein
MKMAENAFLRKPKISVIQRVEEPEEELQMKIGEHPLIQARGGMTNIQADFESNLNRARTGGSHLDQAFRAKVEPQMGADFSSVKVHTDSTANQLSQSIQAKAFTTGNDIFFKQGTYDPSSRGGQELLTHELTHVVQQNGNTEVQRQSSPNNHEKMLQEAIKILQQTLDVLSPQKNANVNNNEPNDGKLKNQEQGLRSVLDYLKSLQGSEKVNEILEITQPILAAAKGDLTQVNQTQGEQFNQQEDNQTSTPTIQRFVPALAVAGGGTVAGGAGGATLAGVLTGPVGWAILGVVAVSALGYAGYKAYENYQTRTRTEPRAIPRAVPRTKTRDKRKRLYPINWPYRSGRGLPLTAPNPTNTIFVGRRLTRTMSPPRNLALIEQFKKLNPVKKGQAVHHVTPLFLGGPDNLGNLAAIWISYHDSGHLALRKQPHLSAYGLSADLYQHPPGTSYIVSSLV